MIGAGRSCVRRASQGGPLTPTYASFPAHPTAQAISEPPRVAAQPDSAAARLGGRANGPVDNLERPAAVAELVDAQASGACVLRDVEVQVLSAALLAGAQMRAPGVDRANARAGPRGRAAPRAQRRAQWPTGRPPQTRHAHNHPRSSASRAASPRLRASSLCIAAETWLRAVPGERCSAAARSATVGWRREASST